MLIVGYSLSDPDFNHIYRQISLDMANHHPLGLALFPYSMGPKTPERRHWEKLGIRIATFKGGPSPSESFKRFFEINPDPVVPFESAEGVRKWIAGGSSFKDRCIRAKDFLGDPDRARLVRADSHSDHNIWMEPIRCAFTEDEWKQITFIHIDDDQYDETSSSAKRPIALRPDSRSNFTGFKVLDRERFRSQELLSRQIDAFLERRRDLKLDLARWMTFAFKENLNRGDNSRILDLLSWIWRSTVESPVDSFDARNEASDVMRRCLAVALKNGYGREVDHIRGDAQALKVDISGIGPAGDRAPEFLQKMKDGFERMLDGAFVDARTAYEQAGAIAKQRGDAFDAWVAFHGEEDAVLASIDRKDRGTEESQSQTDDYRRRRSAMEQGAKVKEWIEQARQCGERVIQKVIEGFIKQNRQRTVGRHVPHCWLVASLCRRGKVHHGRPSAARPAHLLVVRETR